MKLFLIRHAEAETKGEAEDFSRKLTANGIKEATIAAQFLLEYQIDKIVASSATRTRQTAEIIQSKIKCDKLQLLPELYASNEEKIIEIIADHGNTDKNIAIIAHNPGIFNIALELTTQDSSEHEDLIENGMPPAKIVALDFPYFNDWQDILKYRSINNKSR